MQQGEFLDCFETRDLNRNRLHLENTLQGMAPIFRRQYV
ncbi:hypothetical protein JOE34_004818 [Pseudomonas sp. PvP028]|nr:hypothetical protein [Pseudomonas sp. PvP028]